MAARHAVAPPLSPDQGDQPGEPGPAWLRPRLRVEVEGEPREGFAESYSAAVVARAAVADGRVLVEYEEFVDSKGVPLREEVLVSRLRPAQPPGLKFDSWDQVKSGGALDMLDKDVWWRGVVVSVAPAGASVFFPGIQNSVLFCRGLARLRPGYAWDDGAGGWARRVASDKVMARAGAEWDPAGDVLPRSAPHEPLLGAERGEGVVIGEAEGVEDDGGGDDAPPRGGGGRRRRGRRGGGRGRGGGRAHEHYAPGHELPLEEEEDSDLIHEMQGDLGVTPASPGDGTASGGTPAGGASAEPSGEGDAPGSSQLEDSAEAAGGGADGGEDSAGGGGSEPDAPPAKRRRGGGSGGREAGAAMETEEAAAAEGGDGPRRSGRRRASKGEPGGGGGEGEGGGGEGSEGGEGLRRSGRAAKPRIVYVEGLPVLRTNLYGMEGEPSVFDLPVLRTNLYGMEGEPSVFDRELADDSGELPAGATLAPPAPRGAGLPPRPPGAKRAAPGGGGGGVISGETAAAKSGRQRHNDAVRRDAKVAEVKRYASLAQHIDALEPFVTPAVITMIRGRAALAPKMEPPEPLTQQPAAITACMREYQVEGLQWMVSMYDRGLNAILADEMGLGKTLQTISFLAHLKFERGVSGPHLVVVPLSVLSSWLQELRRWCPALRVVRLHAGDVDERKRLRREVLANPHTFDVAVTTYDMVNSQHFGGALKTTLMWRYVILDEGHKIKSETTLVSQGIRAIQRQHTLLLTGTPLQNNLLELRALLVALYPDVFTTTEPFDAAFDLAHGKVDDSKLAAAHYLLRPFCLRRLKDEVERSLPPKTETTIACPLSECQTFWYRRLLLRDGQALAAMEADVGQGGSRAIVRSDQGNAWRRLMNLVMQLRKVCNHPFCMPESEPDGEGNSPLELLTEASGKLSVLDRLLGKLKEKGHRVVMFTQFTLMLDILQDYCERKGHNFRRLDGSTNRIQRMINIEEFNKPGSEVFVFMLTTRAGGLGVNLQTADTAIIYDSDWNPQWDLQAMARVHRIGQTKPVHIYRLVTQGTVEERIQQRATSKLYLDQMVNRGSTATAQELEGLTKGELLGMLSFGADRIFANDSDQGPTDGELDSIIDRSHTSSCAPFPPAPNHSQPSHLYTQPFSPGPTDGELDSIIDRSHKTAAAALAQKQAAAATEAAAAAAGGGGKGGGAGKEGAGRVKGEEGGETSGGGSDGGAGPSTSGGEAGHGVLKSVKHTAAEFRPEQPALSTYVLKGDDFSALRQQSLKDIGRSYWEGRKRERATRLVEVGGYAVLRENMYSMEQGGISAWEGTAGREAAAERPAGTKTRRQRAGRDYDHCDHCQVCWDGGDLVCCDNCPCSYHPECVGATPAAMARVKRWTCPHHACFACGRNTAKAGGMLLRCEVCEKAFCEDHVPEDHAMRGECELFKMLGQNHPTNACFIVCGADCAEARRRLAPAIADAMAAAAKDRSQRAARQAGVEDERRRREGEAAARAAAVRADDAAAAAAWGAAKRRRESAERRGGAAVEGLPARKPRGKMVAAARAAAARAAGGGGGGGAAEEEGDEEEEEQEEVEMEAGSEEEEAGSEEEEEEEEEEEAGSEEVGSEEAQEEAAPPERTASAAGRRSASLDSAPAAGGAAAAAAGRRSGTPGGRGAAPPAAKAPARSGGGGVRRCSWSDAAAAAAAAADAGGEAGAGERGASPDGGRRRSSRGTQ
ncbi:MAG: P-loop containing nucleoside triphosphate hydrolase protein [Monoraphidium minutum]|nr:MAG: P-loop containing nucleoside triphosphate hydrolase protein [Monoraphidium minutum]